MNKIIDYPELIRFLSINLELEKTIVMTSFDEDLYNLIIGKQSKIIVYSHNKRFDITKNSSIITSFNVKITCLKEN